GTRDHISEVLDDLSGFDRQKKHSQIEQVLNQLRQTLNQTKKVPAPLRGGHYQHVITQPAFGELGHYQQIVKREKAQQPHHARQHPGVERQLADTHAVYMAELKAYHVYGRISTGLDGEPVMIWHLEDRLTGYGVQNQELYRFLQQEGNQLNPDQFVLIDQDTYLAKVNAAWCKGVNYVTGEKLVFPFSWIMTGAAVAQGAVEWTQEDEWGQALLVLGFTYGSYRTLTKLGRQQIKVEEQQRVQAQNGHVNQQAETKPQAQTVNGEVNKQKDQVVLNGDKQASGAENLKTPKATELTMTETVSNHSTDIIKKGVNAGELSRPYVNSKGTNLLLQEIMDSRIPVKDVSLPNGLRWDVPGSFNGRGQGIWELVVDLDTNKIVHFNFTK
ncbi:hypothetical protein SAMN04488134_1233, partial [Amphibacillus marinus]